MHAAVGVIVLRDINEFSLLCFQRQRGTPPDFLEPHACISTKTTGGLRHLHRGAGKSWEFPLDVQRGTWDVSCH